MSEPRLRISVLENFRATDLGGGEELICSEREAAFLIYLALTDQPQTREHLAELFWPQRAPEQSLGNLRVMLSRLRKKLGENLRVSRQTVTLDGARVEVDARRLQQAYAACQEHPGQLAEERLRHCLPAADNPPAAGAGLASSRQFDDWLEEQRRRLGHRIAAARRLLIDLALARGDADAAAAQSSRLVAADPLDEGAQRRHIELLAGNGKRAAALRHYETCRRLLATELGVEPEAATQHLARSIRGQASANASSMSDLDSRARRMLLERLERFWIEGVLLPAMPAEGAIEILAQDRPELVATPFRQLLPTPGRQPPAGSSTESLFERFSSSGRSLLILGAPGGGKTICLLQLARQAMRQAREDPQAPAPAVLHLSSWGALEADSAATTRSLMAEPSLAQWAAEEISLRYYLPLRLARKWIAAGSLMLLLDGLDELTEDRRTGCLAAINRFRREAGLAPIAVCCRTTAYRAAAAAGSELELELAIELQPLTPGQIDRYLKDTDGPLAQLFSADPLPSAVHELLENPLMLSLMSEALEAPRPVPTVARLRHQILDSFVDRMMARCRDAPWPRPALGLQWLRGLANGLLRSGQGVFQIERLQPSWLPTHRARQHYLLASRILGSLVLALLLMLIATLLKPGPILPWAILGSALVHGVMLAGIDRWRFHLPTATAPGRWRRLGRFGLIAGLALGSTLAVFRGIDLEPGAGVLLSSLALAGLFGWRRQGTGYDRDVLAVEALTGSWRGAGLGFLVGGALGGALPVMLLLLFDRSSGPTTWLPATIGPLLLGGGLGAVIGGLRETVATRRAKANYGTWISARSAGLGALWMATAVLLSFSVGFSAFRSLGVPTGFTIRRLGMQPSGSQVLVAAAVCGAYAFLWYGGLEILKHLTLRFMLWRAGILPWRLTPFIELSAHSGVLRHAEGGTIFRHRLLLEHFAADAER